MHFFQRLRSIKPQILFFVCAVALGPNLSADVCQEAKIIDTGSTCCSYWIANNASGVNEHYRQPKHAFANENAAAAFYQNLYAQMPFYEPFSGSTARMAQGWYYDNNGFHAAIDYVKSSIPNLTDPTFEIRAVARGRVVSAYWDDWFGNTIVIEHQASDGTKYRSLYLHLRDGRDHDVAKARAISIPADAANDSNWRKYKRFADMSPLDRHWGTNAQKITVAVGDNVAYGQLIAYSGNTGAGGAGNGLKLDGTPSNSTTANNHLHLFMAVKDPTDTNKWLFIDPYGAYGSDTTGCYNLFANTKYNRFFATHQSDFHNVDYQRVAQYFNYYPKMGRSLQTISIHRDGAALRASGSFQEGGSPAWYTRFYANEADYVRYFQDYDRQGFRPRELSVTIDPQGLPRYTAIWTKKENIPYASCHKLSDAEFDSQWQNFVVKGGYRIEDHFAYYVDGIRRHAVVFVKDGTPFYFVHGMSSGDYNEFFQKTYGLGFRQLSLQVEEAPAGNRLGGVFLRSSENRPAYYGMSSSDYQTKYNQMSSGGFRLHKIQGYDNSGKFSAIWVKP